MNLSIEPGSDHEFLELLRLARQGETEALGKLIDRYRPFLLKIAGDEGDSELQAKVGASDLVQYTCLDALQAFPKFRGRTSSELVRWLRQILLHRLGGVRDRYRAGKRDIGAEIPLDVFADGARPEVQDALATPPSDQLERNEEAELIELALQALPDLDRTIVEMRQKDGHAFAEIARQLHLTEDGARKRWARAIQALQDRLRRFNERSSP